MMLKIGRFIIMVLCSVALLQTILVEIVILCKDTRSLGRKLFYSTLTLGSSLIITLAIYRFCSWYWTSIALVGITVHAIMSLVIGVAESDENSGALILRFAVIELSCVAVGWMIMLLICIGRLISQLL